jgi:hypothetical protein
VWLLETEGLIALLDELPGWDDLVGRFPAIGVTASYLHPRNVVSPNFGEGNRPGAEKIVTVVAKAMTGRETPVTGAGAPVTGTEAPVTGRGTPAWKRGTPVATRATLRAGVEGRARKARTTVRGGETGVTGGEVLVAGAGRTRTGSDTTVKGAATTVTEVETSASLEPNVNAVAGGLDVNHAWMAAGLAVFDEGLRAPAALVHGHIAELAAERADHLVRIHDVEVRIEP